MSEISITDAPPQAPGPPFTPPPPGLPPSAEYISMGGTILLDGSHANHMLPREGPGAMGLPSHNH